MTPQLNLCAGWIAFLAGAASGALLGLGFHRENFLGGYDSFRRRILRLGHIACFGMGLLNIAFALSVSARPIADPFGTWASWAWLVALVTMPLCCALAAWRKNFRVFFPVPVAATFAGIGALLLGWWDTFP